LKRHEQTHINAKDYGCDDCGKRFKLREYLGFLFIFRMFENLKHGFIFLFLFAEVHKKTHQKEEENSTSAESKGQERDPINMILSYPEPMAFKEDPAPVAPASSSPLRPQVCECSFLM
jgi:hypothetical protein